MSARTILTLANGRGVDLLAPMFYPADFSALAEMLAKEKRFNGATAGVEYSVAEHCCLGVDAILAEEKKFGSRDKCEQVAAYFLMHDLAEAVWKDDTTPKKHAIAERIAASCGVTADAVLNVLEELSDGHDAALHAAAGLQWPMPPALAPVIKTWDKIMFVTEWRDLMGDREHPDWSAYANIEPLHDRIIQPWRWNVARTAWLMRAAKLLPALKVPT